MAEITATRQQYALDRLSSVIEKARKAGADAADAVMFESTSESISCRKGHVEDIERSENNDLGLRVFVGKRQAIVSTTDVTSEALGTLAERAVSMASVAPEDPYCGLADPELMAHTLPDLDLFDSFDPTPEQLKERALATEDVALQTAGITNSEGAGAGFSQGYVALMNSNGFAQSYRSSNYSLSVSVIAGEGTAMERDYAYSSKRHHDDLTAPEDIGRDAARRALRRLNPQKIKTANLPIVMEPRVSRSLMGHLSSAINGHGIARGTSFLKDKMGQQIFAKNINIIDNPHLRRGPASKPYDGEGCQNSPLHIIEDGMLKCWLLDSHSAQQLGLHSNGRAARGTSSPPSPSSTNLYLTPGDISPEDLIGDIAQGVYVTDLIGMGVNGVTGDYSRGAAGFLIENGKISHAVSEITIAGNLLDMFSGLSVANDLEHKYGTDAPTIRLENMTIAGS
ncbi:MAG: modulator protein [Kordiimonas sp.]|nr:modulator protein [Kordiimonas sp.]